VPRGQRDGSPRPYSRFSGLEPLLFLSSSSLIVVTRLSGPLQTHYFSENLVAPGIELGRPDLQPEALTTRPQKQSQIHYICR
jgi:hypothetical protein